MQVFKLEKVPYYSQRDNKVANFVSCFPTSMAMAMAYCLDDIGKNKTAVGCHSSMQLEDYINELIYDQVTKAWMVENQGKIGSWIWQYQRRTIYAVEAYLFNRLMNALGFTATHKVLSYDTYCTLLEDRRLPIVVGGNFSSVSRVSGHVCCGIGFNKVGLQELIVRDPFGNALKGYPRNQTDEQNEKDGFEVAYGLRFYGKGSFNTIVFDRS
jgi:hypothetical protein